MKNPRAMMRVAMAFLLVFFIWPRFVHTTFGLSPDWVDGLRGVLIGVTLGLQFLILLRHGRGRCADENRT